MTRHAQARSVAALAIAVVILVVGFTAAEDWTSYLDPSLISEITLSGGELYLATGGGLVIFDPATVGGWPTLIRVSGFPGPCPSFHPRMERQRSSTTTDFDFHRPGDPNPLT